jgi:hypothetical protein
LSAGIDEGAALGSDVLVLTTYPSADASRRLRIDPLVQALGVTGDVVVHELLPDRAFRLKNHRIGRFYALLVLILRCVDRIRLLLTFKQNTVIVHREAFPFLTPWAERIVCRRARLAVLDMDDAIYENPGHGQDWRRWFRDPTRARAFPHLFDVITVGSPRLFEGDGMRARKVYYPTCPPSAPVSTREQRRVIWIGSESTLQNVELVLGSTLRACEQNDFNLLIIGGRNVERLRPHERLETRVWSAEAESDALEGAAIGIMPLKDDPWDRGKSSYKALRYATAGIPSLISPIGMNGDLAVQYPALYRAADGDWFRNLNSLMSGDISPRFGIEVQQIRKDFDSAAAVERVVREIRGMAN